MASNTDDNALLAPRNVWGSPYSPKRALLLHGLTCSPHCMIYIAEKLSEHGYYVIAPDLPGHGIGARVETYTWDVMDNAVVALFTEATYNLVVGFSMGGVLALRAIHKLPPVYHERSQLTRVVLLDPPIRNADGLSSAYYALFSDLTRNPPKPEFFLEHFPRWTQKDAVLQVLASELCDPLVVDHLLQPPRVWAHHEYLANVPSCIELIFLFGDTETGGICCIKELDPYPQYERRIIKGASHWIPYEFPGEVVEACIAPEKESSQSKHKSRNQRLSWSSWIGYLTDWSSL
ncbi:alpha beta-hydrolase [Coniophora puteana RWD-64-598 SS2]|uniref:Alpha beta-hydrolase n=1 Tax=Coniophora puteana (strain RWD-64-598) TaxID=741705 RepID=A0A5M3M837_CONPW|nr:alpha beta-hydrolase [Coniophora puteana RWD-64-598 SS2]EIW75398.1 alpha beta-hydrolase [Coniophora puteana RWD-64-598 SS2]